MIHKARAYVPGQWSRNVNSCPLFLPHNYASEELMQLLKLFHRVAVSIKTKNLGLKIPCWAYFMPTEEQASHWKDFCRFNLTMERRI